MYLHCVFISLFTHNEVNNTKQLGMKLETIRNNYTRNESKTDFVCDNNANARLRYVFWSEMQQHVRHFYRQKKKNKILFSNTQTHKHTYIDGGPLSEPAPLMKTKMNYWKKLNFFSFSRLSITTSRHTDTHQNNGHENIELSLWIGSNHYIAISNWTRDLFFLSTENFDLLIHREKMFRSKLTQVTSVARWPLKSKPIETEKIFTSFVEMKE